MIITNKHNLPQSIYEYLTFEDYDGYSDDPYEISTTQLLRPAQEIILVRQHFDKIEVDVTELMHKVGGSSMHAWLEKIHKPPERMKVKMDGKWTVTGKADKVHNGRLTDHKETSVGVVLYGNGEREKEWALQLSIYRYLYQRVHGITLDPEAYIDVRWKDWRKGEKDRDKSGKYPEWPYQELPFITMSLSHTEAWIMQRLATLDAALAGHVPECSDEDRWFNDRTKKYNKCEGYCDARSVCPQANKVEVKQ